MTHTDLVVVFCALLRSGGPLTGGRITETLGIAARGASLLLIGAVAVFA